MYTKPMCLCIMCTWNQYASMIMIALFLIERRQSEVINWDLYWMNQIMPLCYQNSLNLFSKTQMQIWNPLSVVSQ